MEPQNSKLKKKKRKVRRKRNLKKLKYEDVLKMQKGIQSSLPLTHMPLSLSSPSYNNQQYQCPRFSFINIL